MKLEDFAQIEIQQSGIYRLVPETQLNDLIKSSAQANAIISLISTQLTSYGDAVRIFRSMMAFTKTELADKAGLERKALYLLEENKTRRPQPETHLALQQVLGIGFDQTVRSLGFYD